VSVQTTPRQSPAIVECPTFGAHAVFSAKGLQSLSAIHLPPNIKSLNAENNQIVDFVGFIPSPYLEVLNLANNPIASLRGMPPLPKLTTVNMTGTPFSRTQFYRVSLLLLFGKSVRVIDGERISGTERQIAVSYPQGCDALVRAGWIVSYPPPAPQELRKITTSLAEKVTQKRTPIARAVPVMLRKPKRQSKLMDETLKEQEAELAKLEQDIQKVRARATKK
jgi:hypothetical protein